MKGERSLPPEMMMTTAMMKMTPRETGREREEGEGEKEGRGSTTFRKYALGWNDFLLDRVAECFRERCLHSREGASFPDSTLLIVPTAEAGRLLREAIAEKFRPEGGIVSLHVETPACLATPQRPCADSVLTSSRWIRVLKAIKAEEYPNLLKGLEKYRNSSSWLLGIAENLQHCRKELAAEGLSISEVKDSFARIAREKGSEELWDRSFQFAEFEKLEEEYLRCFSPALPDPVAAQLEAIARPQIPDGIRKILFASCPDPLPAAMLAARNLAAEKGISVELWIAAPKEELNFFDAFGRPLPQYWEKQNLDLPEESIRKLRSPEECASRILGLYENASAAPPLVIGMLDGEITESLLDKHSLLRGNASVFYAPQEKTLSSLPLTRTLLTLLNLTSENPSFEQIAGLARDPFFAAYGSDLLKISRWESVLVLLDKLQSEHLPLNLPQLESLLLRTASSATSSSSAASSGAFPAAQAPYPPQDGANAASGETRNDKPPLLPAATSDDNSPRTAFPADSMENDAEKGLSFLCACIREWSGRLSRSGNLLEDAYRIFAEIAPHGEHLLSDRKSAAEELEQIRSLLLRFREAAAELTPDLQKALFRHLTGRTQITVHADPGALTDLTGFLELPWTREKHLLIAGFNEESFQYGPLADAILPDHARSLLGLRDRKFLYAADVYRFKTLLEPRKHDPDSSLQILFCGSSAKGDVLKPSRLLFQVPDPELPGRAKILFSDDLLLRAQSSYPEASHGTARTEGRHSGILLLAAEGENNPEGHADYCAGKEGIRSGTGKKSVLYFPRCVLPKKRISVTGFKAYLACPFRYYLERVLGANALDDRNVELDNLQFGNLIHLVLQAFGNSALRNESDPGKIERYCLDKLHEIASRELPSAGSGIPRLQLEIMKNNLEYFAKVQALTAQEGWEIRFTERKIVFPWEKLFHKVFPDERKETWREGIVLSGKFDRLDFSPSENAWRILDYKTNRESRTPAGEHLFSPQSLSQSDSEENDWRAAGTDEKGKKLFWKDLQLPLYRLAFACGFFPEASPKSGETLRCAYFNLPLACSDTAILPFSQLDAMPELSRSAARCADQILKRIFSDHCFWPPEQSGQYFADDLSEFVPSLTVNDFDPAFPASLQTASEMKMEKENNPQLPDKQNHDSGEKTKPETGMKQEKEQDAP